MPSEGMSLLAMGFALQTIVMVEDAGLETKESAEPSSLTTPNEQLRESLAARIEKLLPKQGATTHILVVIAEADTL